MERILFYLRLFPARRPSTIGSIGRCHRTSRTRSVRPASRTSRGSGAARTCGTTPRRFDRATVFARHAPKAAVQAWNRRFATIIAEAADASGQPLFYEEVFHTDGGGSGPMRRGFLGLVVDPDRIPEYEALHADPWPDMLEAIARSGYANYSGFRRGNHVVYYGEYHPDMDTVGARMAATEVNTRWGKAFEGIITTITTEDGRLITADEVYHQD
ncbi:MAG: L-rhamnose mutarotase [Chloroflexota bacterium]